MLKPVYIPLCRIHGAAERICVGIGAAVSPVFASLIVLPRGH